MGRFLFESDDKCSPARELDHLRVEFSAVGFLGWARRFGVKASKFTDVQKAFVIKRGEEGTPVAEIPLQLLERIICAAIEPNS